MGEFSQSAGKILTQPTINITIPLLEQYRQRFQFLLAKIHSVDNQQDSVLTQLRNLSYTDEKLSKMESKKLAAELLKQKSQFKDNAIFQEMKLLIDQLGLYYKEAYELINKFRAEFFMPITYSYGFTYENQTYSVSGLTFEDISELITIQIASKTTEIDNLYKLRFYPTKGALEKFMATHKNKLIKISETKENESTLWNTLEQYKQKYNSFTSLNKGNVYEVYRSILNEKNVKNGPPAPNLNEEYILSKFIEIKNNNLSWTRGGDVGTEQDKFMNASVTSAKTLIKTLTSLVAMLDSKNLKPDLIAEKIAVLFGNQNFDNKVLTKSQEVALKAIKDDILSKLNLTK